jgi:8-oxo-dGTP pyrophosphatase MutT (NUDIX family)
MSAHTPPTQVPSERRAFSVAVYPRHKGRCLLIHHRRLKCWLPPGGECEPGETPLEAAARELREETGLRGTFPPLSEIEGTPPGLIGYEEHRAGSKGTHCNFVFVVDVDTDEVRANGEFTDWRWVGDMRELDDAPGTATATAPRNVGQLLQRALAATPGGLYVIARRWLQAFCDHDLDSLLSLYAENAVHLSPKLRAARPETQGRIVGKPALRAWWADAFARLPELRYECQSLTADDQRVFMEYLRVLPGEPALAVAEVLEIRDGLIHGSRVFHG